MSEEQLTVSELSLVEPESGRPAEFPVVQGPGLVVQYQPGT